MKRFFSILKKTLVIAMTLAVYSIVTVYFYENFVRTYIFPPADLAKNVNDPTEKTPVPTPQPIPSIEPTMEPTPEIAVNPSPDNVTTESPDALMIPVVGVKREQLQDTFSAARSEGRVHNAIDIMAAGGTPVVAVADGEIARFFDSVRGGITIYQYSLDRRYVYYYAHLQKRADNLKEKDFIRRGTVVGYVGDTGNSGSGNFHLHFSITLLDDPKRIFDGTEINPYPLLKNGIEAR